jgi:cytochrome c5
MDKTKQTVFTIAPPPLFTALFLVGLVVGGCAGTLDDPDSFDGKIVCEGGCVSGAQAGEAGASSGGGGGSGAGAAPTETVVPKGPDGTTDLPVGDATRGQNVVAERGCRACHGPTLAGSPDTEWSPNLTSDLATGLGSWTDKEILTAVRSGTARDGRELCGSMPTFPVNRIDDAGAADLIAYLRALPAVPETRAGSCE